MPQHRYIYCVYIYIIYTCVYPDPNSLSCLYLIPQPSHSYPSISHPSAFPLISVYISSLSLLSPLRLCFIPHPSLSSPSISHPSSFSLLSVYISSLSLLSPLRLYFIPQPSLSSPSMFYPSASSLSSSVSTPLLVVYTYVSAPSRVAATKWLR